MNVCVCVNWFRNPSLLYFEYNFRSLFEKWRKILVKIPNEDNNEMFMFVLQSAQDQSRLVRYKTTQSNVEAFTQPDRYVPSLVVTKQVDLTNSKFTHKHEENGYLWTTREMNELL